MRNTVSKELEVLRLILIVPLSVLVIPDSGLAQSTWLVTHDKEDYYEEYEVLADDKKVKHGTYLKLLKGMYGFAIESQGEYKRGNKFGHWESYYGTTNNIKESGYYKFGLKDSVWNYYFMQDSFRKLVLTKVEQGMTYKIMNNYPVVRKRGAYAMGVQSGVWEYFDASGRLVQKYNHTSRQLEYLPDSLENHVALYIGGEFSMREHLYKVFDFDGLMNSVQTKIHLKGGRLVYRFLIDDKGVVRDIIEESNSITNKKIIRRAYDTVESTSNHWVPKSVGGVNQPEERRMAFDLVAENNGFSVRVEMKIELQ